MDWISVKDRLPEYGKEIIINNRYGVSVAYYVENGGGDYFCNGGCFILNSATHWMPLPEPPKEIEE